MKTLYLVMLSHSMDDIPLAIFEKVGEAVKFAKTASWDVPENIAAALGVSCSTPSAISLVLFIDGVPSSRDVIRDYDGE